MIADENVKNPNRWFPRTRWIVQVAILCVPILLSILSFAIGREAKLPHTGFQLARFVFVEFLMWGLAFAAAFKISGVTAERLCLRVGNPLRVLAYGVGYFIVIRIMVFAVLFVQLRFIHSDSVWSGSETVFGMLDVHGIVRNPVFSFSVFGIVALIAGLTEELWRVGMLRGLQGWFPRLNEGRRGNILCVAIVAVIFGVAHMYLGWLGVENAILLGFLFGLIIIYRHSYWEAAIAHTLFDAFSFAGVAFLAFHPEILNVAIVAEATKGDSSKIEHFLKLGGNVDGTWGTQKVTALKVAVEKRDPVMVNFLLSKGANTNIADMNGDTPLMIAAEKGDLECIRLLSAKGAKIDIKDIRGYTALHFAVENNKIETVQLLIDSGAHVNTEDSAAETPLALARKKGLGEIAAILEKAGAK